MSFAKFTQAIPLLVTGLALVLAVHLAQAQTEKVLYNFCSAANCADGGSPRAGLTADGKGNFYGAAIMGGAFGTGNAFELSPNGGGGWNYTVLFNFPGGAAGGYPNGPLILDSAGNLYGTTQSYGADYFGVVFELSPVGGSWEETVLYNFTGGADGGAPESGLIIDLAGNLYGTTSYGNKGTISTVFELSRSGGSWTYQVIYTNNNKPVGSAPGLTMDAAGNLFGALDTSVFELSPNGRGGWVATAIHTFPGAYIVYGIPVLDRAGNLYITTFKGGAKNLGTVYKLSPGKTGKWTALILHSFSGGADGANPSAGVVLDANGNVYGTTIYGGPFIWGTVFELVAPTGKNKYKYTEKILWNFDTPDGAVPQCSLIFDSAGNLYGTTEAGGSSAHGQSGYGYGVVFELTP